MMVREKLTEKDREDVFGTYMSYIAAGYPRHIAISKTWTDWKLFLRKRGYRKEDMIRIISEKLAGLRRRNLGLT